MDDQVGNGWWQATDGFWYPPEARPGEPWHGTARGPNGERPPGPGWWLASDYQWYPPDARPGEPWPGPAGRSFPGAGADGPGTVRAPGRPTRSRPVPARAVVTDTSAGLAPASGDGGPDLNRAALVAALGLALILVGIVTLSAVRLGVEGASTWLRLLAWSPVAAGSAVTLVGALQYLNAAEERA